MKIFLIIFIVWMVMFLFSWALVHGAKLQREKLGLFEEYINLIENQLRKRNVKNTLLIK